MTCVEPKHCLSDPALDVMSILNNIVHEFPAAISFAPGRPGESLLDVESYLRAIHYFVNKVAGSTGKSEKCVLRSLGQYSRTTGIINDVIAKHLERDEQIIVSPESIIVTVGAQEAIAIVLAGLFDPVRDVLLTSDPTYIGITGVARLFGIRVLPLPSDNKGLDPEQIEDSIASCMPSGRPRALYDIPNFNNPLGTKLSTTRKLKVVEVCRKLGILLIEDNPYGMFTYEGEQPLTIKSMDRDGTVLYIGTFSKTILPGLRVGYLVADQRIASSGVVMAEELGKVKSLMTVNTSPLMQAAVGGVLLKNDYSLRNIMRPKIAALRQKRDAMLQSLSEDFAELAPQVTWNEPSGGFFVTMSLPFRFGREEMTLCAAQYGVIVCPMSLFAVGGGRECEVRLAFSYVSEDEIRHGVSFFAQFVRDRATARSLHYGLD
jgi:(S)-3,5-dihydroxyphenylglycine transaminase